MTLLSKVCFDVAAGLYCEFINDIIGNQIYISNIVPTEIGFTAMCLAKDYRYVAKLAKKYGCKIRIQKKKGIYFHMRRSFKRKGIYAGILVIFISITLFSQVIWRIDVIAPTQNITQDVFSLLYKNGFYAGAVFSQEKNQDIIQQIFMDVDNVGYVTLNFYKGILTCKVDGAIQKLPYLENSHTGNIVAAEDGVIEKLEIYSGFSDVEIGQSVQKGQLLVSASYIDRNGTLQQVMPRAYIQANCVKYYQANIMFNKKSEMRTGKYTDRITLKLLGRDLVVKKEKLEEYEIYDKERTFEYIQILGFRIPVTKETVRYYQKKQTEIIKDEQSAMAAAKRTVDTVIDGDALLVYADSKEYSYSITEDGVTAVCKVTGHYDIAK